jgi:electron transfer flavoprotein beta subunit
VLTDHLSKLRPAVVLAGCRAECGEASGMLPYLVSQALGSQLVASAVSITLRGDTARVVQAMPRGGRRALRVALPVTLTLDRAGPQARMSAFGPAQRGRIQVAEADLSGSGPALPSDWQQRPARVRPRRLRTLGQASAAERLRSIQPMRASAGTRLLDLDPGQAARAIWQYLVDEALVEVATGADPGSEAQTGRPTAGHAEPGSA